MQAPAAPTRAGTDAQHDSSRVAGSIRPSAGLPAAIAMWREEMEARAFKPKTVSRFVANVQSAMRECGWSSVDDLTTDALSGYLEAKRKSGEWKSGGTYNGVLSTFRNLCELLVLKKMIPEDPTKGIRSAKNRAVTTVRAASTDEARKLIAYAYDRCRTDKRCRSSRDVYYLVLYSMGGRRDEPAMMRWKRHVFEGGSKREASPHFRFTPEINKNGLDQDVPMTRELAAVLREHRAAMKRLSRTVEFVERVDPATGKLVRAYVDPDHPEAYLFASVPPPHVIRSDRAACGIEAKDEKGQAFSWHSARDWFVTTLTDLGLSATIVRRLSRHEIDAHTGYYQGTMASLSDHVSRLPELWPRRVEFPDPSGVTQDGPGPVDGGDPPVGGGGEKKSVKNAGLKTGSSRNSSRHASQRTTDSGQDPAPNRSPEACQHQGERCDSGSFSPPPRRRADARDDSVPRRFQVLKCPFPASAPPTNVGGAFSFLSPAIGGRLAVVRHAACPEPSRTDSRAMDRAIPSVAGGEAPLCRRSIRSHGCTIRREPRDERCRPSRGPR